MTFYSFSHFIQSWLLPPGVNLLLIALGFVLWFYSRTFGTLFMALGVLSLWLFSLPIVAYTMINRLQDQYPVLQEQVFNHPEQQYAIVVLGGGDTVQAEYGYKRTVSDFTLHRLDYGVYLKQKTHLPLILSGGKNLGSNESEAGLMADVLHEKFNIHADYLEDKSLTTADESQFVLPILKENNIKGIYLVTNAWHMPRSVYIFECAGIKVIPAPMGHYVYGPGYALISYFPNMEALYASSIAMHEYIGLMRYKMRYGKHCVSSKTP